MLLYSSQATTHIICTIASRVRISGLCTARYHEEASQVRGPVWGRHLANSCISLSSSAQCSGSVVDGLGAMAAV